MINPLELRIGNYIEMPNEVYPTEVAGVTRYLISDGFGEMELERFDPIPLTEEWLLKFGFELSLNGGAGPDQFYYDGPVPIDFDNDGKLYLGYRSRDYDCEIYNHNEIEYVHQLQNIVFALTGEELTIKETV